MMRKTPLRRSKGLSRGPAPRRRRSAVKAAEKFDREYGGDERMTWLKGQPCAVSGQRGDIVAAHVKTGGTGRKADAKWTIPLLRTLHDELHQHGVKTFEAKYRVNLLALAALTEAHWRHFQSNTRSTT
jgi:hypothetical protein